MACNPDAPLQSDHHDNPPKCVLAGLFLISAATLLLEISLTRILSVTLWYHFAFMVVSTALFGLGFAGVMLSLRKNAHLITDRCLSFFSLGTPIAFSVGYLVFHLVPFEPFSLGTQPVQWIYLPVAYCSVSAPFFFSGATIAALLTRYAARVHHLYWVDLTGAGVGSVAVVGLLPLLGGPATVMISAALAAVAGALIGKLSGRKWFFLGLGTACVLLVLAAWADDILPYRISSNKVAGDARTPVERILKDKRYHRFTSWNNISRIDVVEYRDRMTRLHRNVLIDAGTAMTRLAHPQAPLDELAPTRDEEGFFVRMYERPDVLVVGSGGGREVLLALQNRAERVVAVEINPDINRLVRELMADFTGNLYQHPRVESFTDEARSFLRRSKESFHVIHCPHTISNAALSSGSLALSENHLMTIEAFGDYLDHLTPNGVLVVTRPEAHLPRLLITVKELFEQRGLKNIGHNLLAWKSKGDRLSFYAGIALKKQPFSDQETKQFASTLEERNLVPLYFPDGRDWGYFTELLTHEASQVKLPFAAVLKPATDDKPFFNQRADFLDIGISDLISVFSQDYQGRMALEERPVAEATLLVLLVQTVIIAVLFMIVPLVVFRRRRLKGTGRLRTIMVFAALGFAYIIIEVGFIQRFTLFLGRPVVVFSCVLATLLITSGFGSAWAQRYQSRKAPQIICLVAMAVSALFAGITPWIVKAGLFLPLGLRVLTVIILLTPLGFIMGMPYPMFIKRLNQKYPERIPWAFGINGFASVAGSIGAVILGMAAGYTAVLCIGVICYGFAALAGDPTGYKK